MRRLVPERLCLMLGSALVLAAVCLYVYDRLEDARAGAQAASAVSQLRQSQSIAAVSETEQPADSAESLPTEDAESEPEPVSETPASSIEREYLGVLTIPTLGLELPVQTEWSKANLKVSPCRQCGSTAGGDLVIAAHNYKSHFGRLSSLSKATRCVSLHRTALRQCTLWSGLRRSRPKNPKPCGRAAVPSCSTPAPPAEKRG